MRPHSIRIRLERLTFAYADAAPILDRAELTLDGGWTGLVGENGAGKSTLLALVAGALLLVTHDAFAARCTSSTWRLVSRRVES